MSPHMSRRPAFILCMALAALLQAPVYSAAPALRWTVDTARPASTDWAVFRGESIHLEPVFISYNLALTVTNYTATLYWQTNNMGSAWWSTPAQILTNTPTGRVRATWHPTNDVGATSYNYFIGMESIAPAARQYRAHGRIQMRHAPGYVVNEIPLPARVIDFDLVEVYGAPWIETEADPEFAAWLANDPLAPYLTAETDPEFAAWLDGDPLSALDAARLIQSDGNAWQVIQDGTTYVHRVSYAADKSTLVVTGDLTPDLTGTYVQDTISPTFYYATVGNAFIWYLDDPGYWLIERTTSEVWTRTASPDTPTGDYNPTPGDTTGIATVAYAQIATTNIVALVEQSPAGHVAIPGDLDVGGAITGDGSGLSGIMAAEGEVADYIKSGAPTVGGVRVWDHHDNRFLNLVLTNLVFELWEVTEE